jgi:hypothetical protein
MYFLDILKNPLYKSIVLTEPDDLEAASFLNILVSPMHSKEWEKSPVKMQGTVISIKF